MGKSRSGKVIVSKLLLADNQTGNDKHLKEKDPLSTENYLTFANNGGT